MNFDDALLDDLDALTAGDPTDTLRGVATAGAQVRRALAQADDLPAYAQVADDGRPRALLTVGMGGSAIAGDVLAAAVGPVSPIAVSTLRGYRLPGWVGSTDLVVCVSCSGETEETLEVFEEAARRGSRLVVVTAPGSSLMTAAEVAKAAVIPVDVQGLAPRASMWALTTPLLLLANALGLGDPSIAPDRLNELADRIDAVAAVCAPTVSMDTNPGKDLALTLAGTLPVVWGTTDLTGVAAYRFQCQLAENADYPGIAGVLPEPNHNQVVILDGPFAQVSHEADDLFRDRVDDQASGPAPLRLVLLRDSDEHEQVRRRADVSADLAQDRSIGVTQLIGDSTEALVRFGELVAVIDFATVYLALGYGIDPDEIAPLTELKRRIAR